MIKWILYNTRVGGRNPKNEVNHVHLVSPYVCIWFFFYFRRFCTVFFFMSTNLYKILFNSILNALELLICINFMWNYISMPSSLRSFHVEIEWIKKRTINKALSWLYLYCQNVLEFSIQRRIFDGLNKSYVFHSH